MYKNTVSLLDITENDNILDIGYGNGYLLECIYKKTKANLYGIDVSEDMKMEATKRNQVAMRDGKLFLETGDCCDLKYSDNHFGAITSINTIYFWSDAVRGLKEIHRVLKDGSSFYNVAYTKKLARQAFLYRKGI
ncbi:MAG: class I SAM-dependent methyltransferase [Bacteroidales bacterium]|nr:class I SAM-dependent methyltransferase [Bacteroidales bacterium]